MKKFILIDLSTDSDIETFTKSGGYKLVGNVFLGLSAILWINFVIIYIYQLINMRHLY